MHIICVFVFFCLLCVMLNNYLHFIIILEQQLMNIKQFAASDGYIFMAFHFFLKVNKETSAFCCRTLSCLL